MTYRYMIYEDESEEHIIFDYETSSPLPNLDVGNQLFIHTKDYSYPYDPKYVISSIRVFITQLKPPELTRYDIHIFRRAVPVEK